MFPLLGTGEVIALLLVGAFTAPMFVLPTHRGGPLLFPFEFEVNDDRWPAVLIAADHAGFVPWLLRLINKAPTTGLQVGATMLAYDIGGVFRPRTDTIPLTDVMGVPVKPWHPTYHIAAMCAVGFPMLGYAVVGRLSLAGFGVGFAIVALCGVLASVQSTDNLVIEVRGRKKPLVFAFSTLPHGKKRPVVTHLELCRVSDRIMHLATAARARVRQ